MKYIKAILGVFTATVLFTGCSSTATPQQKVSIQADQVGNMNCVTIENTLHDIEFEVAELVKLKEQREQRSFALKTLLNMTMAFLSSPSAVDRVGSNSHPVTQGLTEQEYTRMIQLKQYYLLVVGIGTQKNCRYSKDIQQTIDQYKPTD